MRTEDIVGRWQLVEYSSRTPDGEETYPLGRPAVGDLIYTAGGAIAAQLCAVDRARFPVEDPRSVSVEERAEAFLTYVAYFGTYQLTENTVVHHVTASSLPNWTGSSQERIVHMDGDRLILTGALPTPAGPITVELSWTRAE